MNELRQSMTLKKLNKKVFFNLVSIADHLHFDEVHGANQITEKLFNTDDYETTLDTALWLAWYLFDDNSKRAIIDLKINRANGFSIEEVTFETPEKKLRSVLMADEIQELLACIVATFKASNPDEARSIKKKMMAVKS